MTCANTGKFAVETAPDVIRTGAALASSDVAAPLLR